MSEFFAALEAGTREHYVDAPLYDHEYRSRRQDLHWYRELARRTASTAGDLAPGSSRSSSLRLLELGCGSGRLLLPLAQDGHTVYGIDRSAPMLRRCQERLSKLNARARTRVHIIEGDFRALPFAAEPAQRFPLILCPFNGFSHLYTRPDVELCLAEVRRLLAPGGIFAFDISNPDCTWLSRNPSRRFSRTRFRHPTSGERLIYTTSHLYDPATQVCWIRFYYEADLASATSGPAQRSDLPAAAGAEAADRPPVVVQLAQRMFYPAEIESLLHYNGFELLEHAGSFDGEALSPVSREQVICARVR
jgi:SAM-dependent methyltransferase